MSLHDFNDNAYASKACTRFNFPKDWQVVELHLDSAGAGARGGHVIINGNYPADDYDNRLANFIGGFFPGRSNIIVGRTDLYNCNICANKGYSYRLIECCFISNQGDMDKCNSCIDDVARGILQAFDIPVTPSEPPKPKRREDDLKAISIPRGNYEVFRLYNSSNGDHHYTSLKSECEELAKQGWKEEGIAWTGADTGAVLYRMYNPNAGDHLLTADIEEASALWNDGWLYEGANIASARDGKPIYRLYDKSNGNHFYTADENEKNNLGKQGWKDEGIGFYGV